MRMATSLRFSSTSMTSSCRPSTRGVFVQHAVDLDFDDRAAGDRRQQHATQRVAERVAEATLQRLDHDLRAIGADAFDVNAARTQHLVGDTAIETAPGIPRIRQRNACEGRRDAASYFE